MGEVQDTGRARDEKDMGEILQQLQARDEASDADFVFTCGLTMEPFRDPVITPDGNSYERGALIEHLNKVCCSHTWLCLKFLHVSIVWFRPVVVGARYS
jgi:hypothetical protein